MKIWTFCFHIGCLEILWIQWSCKQHSFDKVAGKFGDLTVEIPFQNSSFPKLSSFFYGTLMLKCESRFPPKQVSHIKDGYNIYANNERIIFFKFYISYVYFVW